MKTVAIKNSKTGFIKMGNAITGKDLYTKEFGECYSVDEKPMQEIWNEKIKDIQEQINNTEIGKDGRLKQLCWCKGNLQIAYLRCMNN